MLLGFPLLSLAIWVPIAAGILVLATGSDRNAHAARKIALVGSILGFLVAIPLYTRFDPTAGGFQFTEFLPWIETFNVNYHLGIDGISLLLILLNSFTTVLVVIAGWQVIEKRVAQYMASFLFLSGFMNGVFSALDVTRTWCDPESLLQGHAIAPFDLERTLRGRYALLGVHNIVLFAMSGIDMAAWDALGQALGLPVATLLGGKPLPALAYNSKGLGIQPLKPLAREATELVKEGFQAVKLRLGRPRAEDDIAALRAVKKAIGPGITLMVDFNQGLSVAEAVRRGRMIDDEGGVAWIEEPVRADDFAGCAKVAREVATPIQIGENFMGPEQMAQALAAGAADYVMPDAQRIGGVTGWMRAAALAQAISGTGGALQATPAARGGEGEGGSKSWHQPHAPYSVARKPHQARRSWTTHRSPARRHPGPSPTAARSPPPARASGTGWRCSARTLWDWRSRSCSRPSPWSASSPGFSGSDPICRGSSVSRGSSSSRSACCCSRIASPCSPATCRVSHPSFFAAACRAVRLPSWPSITAQSGRYGVVIGFTLGGTHE